MKDFCSKVRIVGSVHLYIVGGDMVKSRSPASFVWPGGSVAVKVGGDSGQGAYPPLWLYLPVPPAFAL